MFKVTALYKFTRIVAARLEVLTDEITSFCERRDILGLFLISNEGCNGTIAGNSAAIEDFQRWFSDIPEFRGVMFKDSLCDYQPFKRLKIDRREEIVTLKRTDIVPSSLNNNHLSPEVWDRVLKNEKDILLLDTRNTYETEIGMFRGAVDPQLENFSDFPDYIASQNIPKDKKILMYCTGGIRCEKALVYMQQEGYQNVFQLEGGILNYFKVFPDGGEYDGECFVFDHRVAVDAKLRPSETYKLCPHCGNPAKEQITCRECQSPAVVCQRCLEFTDKIACSKNCSYHLRGRFSVQTLQN